MRDAVGERLLDGVVAVRGAGSHCCGAVEGSQRRDGTGAVERSLRRGAGEMLLGAVASWREHSGARRRAIAARGRSISANYCEKAAGSASAARGCSIMDRDAKTAPHEPDQSGVGAPGGPRGEMGMGAVRGVRRRLPVANCQNPRPPRRASRPRRRRIYGGPVSRSRRRYEEYYVRRSYSGPERIGLGSLIRARRRP